MSDLSTLQTMVRLTAILDDLKVTNEVTPGFSGEKNLLIAVRGVSIQDPKRRTYLLRQVFTKEFLADGAVEPMRFIEEKVRRDINALLEKG